jgi:dihydroflavonol-4-reductase
MTTINPESKILITGASGSLGQQLVYELIKAGIKPIVQVRPLSDCTYINSQGLEKRTADLRRKDQIAQLVDGIDYVIHSAALVDFRQDRLTQFAGINTMGALYLFNAAAKAGVKRFLHVSTVAAVGGIKRSTAGKDIDYMLVNEDSEYNLGNLKIPYFMTKRAAEDELFNAAKDVDMELVMVNPSIIVAPSRNENEYDKVSKFFNKLIIPSIPIRVNMVDVRDVAAGTWLVLNKGKNGQRYILAGDNIKIRELALDVSALVGKIPHLVHFPRKFYDVTSRMWEVMRKVTGRSRITFYPDVVKMLDYDWAFSSRKAHEKLGYNWRSIHVTLTNLLTNNFNDTYLRPNGDNKTG